MPSAPPCRRDPARALSRHGKNESFQRHRIAS
jgi:hypothetical protein